LLRGISAAAILSIVQIAQMEHCQKGDNRTETLRWLLAIFRPDFNENVHYALVKGLGTLLKERTEDKALSFQTDFTLVGIDDEKVLLQALETLDSDNSDSRVLIEAVADLKAYSDGLMDLALGTTRRIAGGKWPIRHVIGVFCTNITFAGDHPRAVLMAEHLFGRVHAVSSKIFETEKEDLFNGLKIMREFIGIDRMPVLLPFLTLGDVVRRVRVIEMASALEMEFSHELLGIFAHCLLSEIDNGAVSSGQSFLDDIIQHELLEHRIKHIHGTPYETSKVLRFLRDIFKPLAEDGSAQQHVVMRLTQLHEERQDAIREEDHTEDEKEGEIDIEAVTDIEAIIQDTETVSLENLATLVKDFTPEMLTTPQSNVKLLDLYCAARLWANTGLIQNNTAKGAIDSLALSDVQSAGSEFLIQQETSKYIAECLAVSVSDAQSMRYTDAFRSITEPWKSEYASADGRWDQNISKLMQDKMLGRIFFKYVLLFVRKQLASSVFGTVGSPADETINQLVDNIQQWQTSDPGEILEKIFLLKELRIGTRSQDFPTWTGQVSSVTQTVSAEKVSLFWNRVAYIYILTHTHTHIHTHNIHSM